MQGLLFCMYSSMVWPHSCEYAFQRKQTFKETVQYCGSKQKTILFGTSFEWLWLKVENKSY